MPRLRFFDPADLDVLSSSVTQSPLGEPPHIELRDGGPPGFGDSLRDAQLAAIREFKHERPEDYQLLEDNRVLGFSVRELQLPDGPHPGTISRRIRRIAKNFKMHVLAHSMAFLLRCQDGFTLCPETASQARADDLDAVGLHEFGMDFGRLPSPTECLEYLQSVWGPLHTIDRRCLDRRERRRFLGGWQSEGQFWLDVTVLIDDRSIAIDRAIVEQQRCIFNLSTGESFML